MDGFKPATRSDSKMAWQQSGSSYSYCQHQKEDNSSMFKLITSSTLSPRAAKPAHKRLRVRIRNMGLFKHLRSKPKIVERDDYAFFDQKAPVSFITGPNHFERLQRRDSQAYDKILTRIFEFVCPHALDTTYCSLDEVDLGETCMLCNMRNLSHCALTCKSWNGPATKLLYTSIRIDSIHYCPLESELRTKRAKKNKGLMRRSRFINPDDDYIYDPVNDPTQTRVHLLAEALRSNPVLGSLVNYLKLAYTVRESVNADITRAVSACPNIMYADLPAGFYNGDTRFEMLRREVEVNCRNLRYMKFVEGPERRSEKYFRRMGERIPWSKLEYLSVEGIAIDVANFRWTLASLPFLKTLVLTDLPDITDDAFTTVPAIPDFPAIQNLELHNLPMVTVSGILKYLTVDQSRQSLTNLTIDGTGIKISTLHSVLANAPNLESLTVISTVERALPIDPLPPLASSTLETLHLDLSDVQSKMDITPKPTDSCHAYLLNSILSGSLRNLKCLYVRDEEFPDALTKAHRAGVRASSVFGVQHLGSISPSTPSPAGSRRPSLAHLGSGGLLAPPTERRPLSHQHLQHLEVFTKGPNESYWIFSPLSVSSRKASHNGSSSHIGHAHREFDAHRRESAVNLEWQANARRSVFIGNGEGGFFNLSHSDEPTAFREIDDKLTALVE